MKVVINKCYGGFSLSMEAQKAIAKLKNQTVYFYTTVYDHSGSTINRSFKRIDKDPDVGTIFCVAQDLGETCLDKDLNKATHLGYDRDIDRSDPDLVKVVEKLGEKADGAYAKLKIIEIPDDITWEVHEYDGMERIEEMHQSWG